MIWTLFNEGWGQFDSRATCEMVRELDPTLPIDAASGWYDNGGGDFKSVHNYYRKMRAWVDKLLGRAFFVSEFGGLTHHIAEHSNCKTPHGYRRYETADAWASAVQDLLDDMGSHEVDGLAGYVYTQVSDIEDEVSGILTYDRKVNRLELAEVHDRLC